MKTIIQAVLRQYTLPWEGCHGLAHWGRVLGNGRRLAAETGADLRVVEYFAILHDSRRVIEATDPEHGPRAAEFAKSLRGHLLDVTDAQFDLLSQACAGHTRERAHPDVTVQTCWDADLLDLGRVGMTPDPAYLGEITVRRPALIQWADGRARFHVVPVLVRDEWGIDLRADGGRRGGRDSR